MSWQGILGQDAVVAGFRRALDRGRLANSYLFAGPEGIGKRTLALKLAQTLLCSRVDPTEMAPCGECPACQQVQGRTHPDIEIVSLPEDKKDIPIELLIGDKKKDRRNKEGFCYNLSRKPFRGGRKIGIIDDADLLNDEGANCLLKTLEEPPLRSLLILISTNPSRQLPTIRSRCQIIRFQPLARSNLQELLTEKSGEKGGRVEELADLGEPSFAETMLWADESFWNFRVDLLRILSEIPLQVDRLVQHVQAFVDQVKAHSERRKRIQLALRLTIFFYRNLLRSAVRLETDAGSTETATADKMLSSAISRATALVEADPTSAVDVLSRLIERSLAAQQHVARNANPATLIACWADDLDACLSHRA